MPDYRPPENDHFTQGFEALKLIPKKYRGSQKFLDVVCWNLRWFHHKEAARVDRIAELLAVMNADLMVLEEVADGSLEPVIAQLGQEGAGHYASAYGTTGGQQRVAFLWDIEWVRSKDDVRELFGKGKVKSSDDKDAFPRLPLWGYFTALPQSPENPPFEFQLVGVHLKSQLGDGGPQRRKAAQKLSSWMKGTAKQLDSDILVLGDFNKPPDDAEWSALHSLEKQGKAYFQRINDPSDFSHLYYTNKQDVGSRLDLVVISSAAKPNLAGEDAQVIRWASLDDFLSTQPTAAQLKRRIKEIKQTISDHMPVLARFYLTEEE